MVTASLISKDRTFELPLMIAEMKLITVTACRLNGKGWLQQGWRQTRICGGDGALQEGAGLTFAGGVLAADAADAQSVQERQNLITP